MKQFSAVPIFFAAAFAAFAQANTDVATSRAMSLPDCIQEALAHNLGLQIDRIAPQISLYDLNSAYGGYDPTLAISGQHSRSETGVELAPVTVSDGNSFSSSLNGATPWGMTYGLSANTAENYGSTAVTNLFDSSSGSVQLRLAQPVLKNFWIDGNRAGIRIAKNGLQQSEQVLREQIITTVTAVEDAYYELIYAQESVQVQQQALDLAQTQLTNDQFRVNIGSLAPLDVQQDEAQAASSKAALISAQNTLSIDENTLKNLLTEDYSRWHGTDIQPTATLEAPLQLFDLQDSWNKGMSGRPDLLQFRLIVEQQGITLKYDQNQLFPELDLIGTYGFNGQGREFSDAISQVNSGDRPSYTYGAQISLPLSNIGPRNQYKTAKANMQKAVLQVKQLEQTVMVEIDNAVKQAQSSYESVDATRQARIYAEAALNAEQTKYSNGKSTTFTVLQLQNSLTAARSNEIRALANYNEALANLAAQEGSTLERNRIDIQTK